MHIFLFANTTSKLKQKYKWILISFCINSRNNASEKKTFSSPAKLPLLCTLLFPWPSISLAVTCHSIPNSVIWSHCSSHKQTSYWHFLNSSGAISWSPKPLYLTLLKIHLCRADGYLFLMNIREYNNRPRVTALADFTGFQDSPLFIVHLFYHNAGSQC